MDILIQELKNELNITWLDDETERKLQRIIRNGQAYLNEKAGAELDYANNFIANQLLMDYGRYAYNLSLELFELNFRRQLLSLAINEGVKARASTKEDTETSP